MNWIRKRWMATKIAYQVRREVLKIMDMSNYFKPTDMLVKAQVTCLLAGIHESIEDVPDLFNLREAVLEALSGRVNEVE